MNMREKLARAIAVGLDRSDITIVLPEEWKGTDAPKLAIGEIADRVLKALREPTPEMVEAGADYRPISAHARDCWTAMIDRAKEDR